MSQEDLKARICKEALDICNERIATNARVVLPEIMSSIQAQLKWLVSYFEGRSADRDKLFELTLGHFAVREVDERDQEFVEALKKAFYVAVKTREGLKLDLNVLGIDS